MDMKDSAAFIAAYLDCAAWADGSEEQTERANNGEFTSEAQVRAQVECKAFMYRALPYMQAWTPEQAGHDFWLTRNGHGSGFWDRQLEHGDVLTAIAKNFGTLSVYVPDDSEYLEFA
jgi:hypothetical protein